MIASYEKFFEKWVRPLSEKKLKTLDVYLKEHMQELSEDFADCFKSFCNMAVQLQQREPDIRIAYIFYSLLYSDLMENKSRLVINAYGPGWYADELDVKCYYDASWAIQYLHELKQELIHEKSKYGMMEYNIENAICQEAREYLQRIITLAKYALSTIEEPGTEAFNAFQSLNKHTFVDVRMGEYFDITFGLYRYDTKPYDSSDIKSLLEQKRIKCYSAYRDLQLGNGLYKNSDLKFCDFSGSNFSGSDFSDSNLVGTSWRNCNLENVNFSFADLSGADFRGASHETATFEMAKLANAKW